MRLWHYKLLKHLPDSQLLAQKRECDLIWNDIARGKKTNHILINYIWEYKDYFTQLSIYYRLLFNEFNKRGFNFKQNKNSLIYDDLEVLPIPFCEHHNAMYLKQCYYNLEEKFIRGQKDFKFHRWAEMYKFLKDEISLV